MTHTVDTAQDFIVNSYSTDLSAGDLAKELEQEWTPRWSWAGAGRREDAQLLLLPVGVLVLAGRHRPLCRDRDAGGAGYMIDKEEKLILTYYTHCS